MQLPEEVIEHIKGFVYYDRNSFSKTSSLIKQLKDDLEHFVNCYLYIVVNSPNAYRYFEISFYRLYFMYRKFKEFENHFRDMRYDQRLLIYRFLEYT